MGEESGDKDVPRLFVIVDEPSGLYLINTEPLSIQFLAKADVQQVATAFSSHKGDSGVEVDLVQAALALTGQISSGVADTLTSMQAKNGSLKPCIEVEEPFPVFFGRGRREKK